MVGLFGLLAGDLVGLGRGLGTLSSNAGLQIVIFLVPRLSGFRRVL
jgi:hypothetical protein